MTIVVEFYDEEALNATLPQKVTCKVVETEPVVKGKRPPIALNQRFGQRCQGYGATLYRTGRRHRRKHRDDGLFRARLGDTCVGQKAHVYFCHVTGILLTLILPSARSYRK